MEENIKRVESRDSDYIKDSTNIHNIRTVVRRLDASYKSLPKKLRRIIGLENIWLQANNFSN
jgi:hypothetical protein